ncbi:cytochrome P450 family protein [Kytococcus sp. Marseille-QA3725]
MRLHDGVPTAVDPGLGTAVLLDPGTWSPAGAMVAHRRLCPAALRVLARVGFALPPALANNDGPDHPRLRAAVAPLMDAAAVRRWRPRIAELAQQGALRARDLLDRDGEVDLATTGPGELPLAVMVEMLGVGPRIPVELLRTSAAPALELFWGTSTDERQVELAAHCAELYAAIRAELRAVRAASHRGGANQERPQQDGLLPRLAEATPDDRVVASAAFFTLVAGHETTRWLLAGILHRAAGDPQEWARLSASPRQVVEEALAHHSSVPRWRRRAATDARLGPEDEGVKVAAGETVAVELTGVGRPGAFAFGVGAHRCLGAPLARAEAEEVVAAVGAVLAAVELRGEAPPVDLFSFAAPGAVRVGAPRRG